LGLARRERNHHSRWEILKRIEIALKAAARSISMVAPGTLHAEFKSGNALVTEADRTANRVLHDLLVQDGEGWLSEESADDLSRLDKDRVWIVDPLDGTREFVAGVPEWSISVALIEDGQAIAGGVCNPATDETFLGAVGLGVARNGNAVSGSECRSLLGAVVLASRSETDRGDWDCFRQSPFVIRPTGSVAYKLALVAAGLADATWTLVAKNEWDIAAGVALVTASDGYVRGLDGEQLVFNRESTLIPGLVACGQHLSSSVLSVLEAPLRAVRGAHLNARD
jgi:myo-inositol-1(or 4)-monophosphatase